MKRLPAGGLSAPRATRARPEARTRRLWHRMAVLAGTAGLAAVALPVAATAPASAAITPALASTLAKAGKLSNEIDHLGQQYDGLKIQLSQSRREITIARKTAARDARLLAISRVAVGQVAAAGYMSGGVSSSLQLLQSSAPQTMLNRAAFMMQLQKQNGTKVLAVQAAAAAARRARLTAVQEGRRAVTLAAAIKTKVASIRAKEKVLNSSAFSQALAIYQRTHVYPDIKVGGSSIGAQALRYALTRLGDPYVWGGAGPNDFDCSGLVMWSYAQVGISLEHYTGDQWTEGEHIPRSQLQPGDLLFFFGLDHVAMYVGKNLMVDAPTYGQPVQIQPIYWSAFDGAVRIVG